MTFQSRMWNSAAYGLEVGRIAAQCKYKDGGGRERSLQFSTFLLSYTI